MRLIALDGEGDPDGVHTIEAWFSSRRGGWVVERLTRDGRMVGLAQLCADESEALEHLEAWLRAHPETQLTASVRAPAAAVTPLSRPRRRAA